jgi:hypothetical protein
MREAGRLQPWKVPTQSHISRSHVQESIVQSRLTPGIRRRHAMATVRELQVRCATCNRRLAELSNEVRAGQVILELKCPRCGQPYPEIVRPGMPREDAADASSPSRLIRPRELSPWDREGLARARRGEPDGQKGTG